MNTTRLYLEFWVPWLTTKRQRCPSNEWMSTAFALAKCSVIHTLRVFYPSVGTREMLCPSLSSATGRLAVLASVNVSLMRPSHDYTASSHRFGLAIDD